nr:MAG TPA: hypothetical protein [Caudoviricetes sp.]
MINSVLYTRKSVQKKPVKSWECLKLYCLESKPL